MSWNEVLTSVRDHLESRVKDHFTGTFTIFVIATNWDVWVTLFFGSNDHTIRISEVKSCIEAVGYYYRFVFKPLGYTFAFRLGNLVFSNLSLALILVGKQVQNHLKKFFEENMYLSIEESNSQRKREFDLRKEMKRYVVDVERENNLLKDDTTKLAEKCEKERKRATNLSADIQLIGELKTANTKKLLEVTQLLQECINTPHIPRVVKVSIPYDLHPYVTTHLFTLRNTAKSITVESFESSGFEYYITF